MPIIVCDRSSYRVTRREYTDEGFLRVPGNVARTGIQEYLARELGLPGDPNHIIRVYRPAEEVFKDESLASFDGVDVTVNHPDGLVNSKNFKKVSAGVVRGVGRRDGDFVQCDLIVKDQSAIDSINSGKCELSAGYTSVYVEGPGISADGEPYDYIQTDIKINHIALVDRARAGPSAKVFDNKTPIGGNTMPVLITTDSGRSVDVADPANAQVVADAFDRLTLRATTAEAAAEKAQATADGTAEKLTAALALGSDDAIKARVAVLGALNTTARKIAGDAFTCDSVDPTEVMRAALLVKRPSVDWAAKSPSYIQASWDMAVEADPEEKDDKTTVTGDASTLIAQLTALAADAAGKSTTAAPVVVADAYSTFKESQANAWKGK